ncbi:hypothetical protein DPEC_G00332220 [Dallia pectoralis]|uniref:Uncharacterized protein n=1 Tax=Dallia pectoralis TaxID=75939 RepID=A0ACC2F641_DALPE|nr:hypothetical protein DPEC_G00332220 [Dallia pectoralis]
MRYGERLKETYGCLPIGLVLVTSGTGSYKSRIVSSHGWSPEPATNEGQSTERPGVACQVRIVPPLQDLRAYGVQDKPATGRPPSRVRVKALGKMPCFSHPPCDGTGPTRDRQYSVWL